MNAILALCHFCEQHGPSVIMCTQPYKQTKSSQSNGVPNNIDIGLDSNFITKVPKSLPISSYSHASTSSSSSNQQQQQQQQQGQLAPTNPTCKACSALLRDEPGIISHDQVANISYVTTQWINDSELNTFVRNACLRSLSSEVYPYAEGAFYFGDELNGHVISYNFDLKDSQARGHQSRYSILVLSWERIQLLNLWPFLILNLSKMVCRLRSAVNQVFNSEMNDNNVSTVVGSSSSQSRSIATGPLRRCATPPAAFAPVLYGQAVAAGAAVATGSGLYYHPSPGGEGQRHRRAVDSDMRSLADLTRDDQIFYRLHAWFTWLLRAAGRRWSIIPPLISPPVDEDQLIAQEDHQALIVAGAEQLGSSHGTVPTMATIHKLSIGSINQTSNLSNSRMFTPSLISSTSTLGATDVDTAKTFDLSTCTPEQELSITLLTLSRLFIVLGLNPFSRLVHHVAIGNQVVVQPLFENFLGPIIIASLAKLLPRGCLRPVIGSPEYLPLFRCNLLSLIPDTISVEKDWNPGDGVLFLSVYRIIKKTVSDIKSTNITDQFAINELVNSMHFRLCSVLPSMDPELVQFKQVLLEYNNNNNNMKNIENFSNLSNTITPVSVASRNLNSHMVTTNFVDQIVQLLQINPPLTTDTMNLVLKTIKNEWINRAKLFHSFKRCQGPSLNGDEATRRWYNFLSSIDCSLNENAAVAKFWQGALSQQSRNNVCHLRVRAPNSSTTSRRTSCSSSNHDFNALFTTPSMPDQL